MSKAGLSVPPGFVILATSFEKFLKEVTLDAKIETILKRLDYKSLGGFIIFMEKRLIKLHICLLSQN